MLTDLDVLRFAAQDQRALIGVDPTTWRRWRRGQARIPRAVVVLLRILVAGELPQGGEAWRGWVFHRGRLYSPEGISYTAGELRALPIVYAQLAALRGVLGQDAQALEIIRPQLAASPAR